MHMLALHFLVSVGRQPAFASLNVPLTYHLCSAAQRVITEQEHAAQENAPSGAATPESEEEHEYESEHPAAGRRDKKWTLTSSTSRRDILAQSSESAFLILTRGTDCDVSALFRLLAHACAHEYL